MGSAIDDVKDFKAHNLEDREKRDRESYPGSAGVPNGNIHGVTGSLAGNRPSEAIISNIEPSNEEED